MATDKTAYLESESGDDLSQTVSGAFHLHGIRASCNLFEKILAAYKMKTTKIHNWLGNGCGRLCLAACPSRFHTWLYHDTVIWSDAILLGFPQLGNFGILGWVAKFAILRLITAKETESNLLFLTHCINVFLSYKVNNKMQKKLLGMLSLTFFFEIVATENTSYVYVSVMVIWYSTGRHV